MRPPGTLPDAESMSIAEMLRVMDVASELRKERELVEQQLNMDDVKSRLRAKLLASADITGEKLSAAEVDFAIDHYYASLHSFEEPPAGLQTFLAHCYVRRAGILTALLIVGGIALLIGFVWSHIPTTQERQQAAISEQLQETYTVRIVSAPGEKSGIDRHVTDEQGSRISGFYLIVEAVTDNGQRLRRTIFDSETQQEKTVTRWGEQVLQEVFERIADDKQSDGILDETTFAVKRKGESAERIILPGVNGQPLERGRQITKW